MYGGNRGQRSRPGSASQTAASGGEGGKAEEETREAGDWRTLSL